MKFIPGTLDVGYIYDSERPLLSKLRAKRQRTNNFADVDDCDLLTDQETMTDLDMATISEAVDALFDDAETQYSKGRHTKQNKQTDRSIL